MVCVDRMYVALTASTSVEQSSSRMRYENCFEMQVGDRMFQMQSANYDALLG